MWIVTRAVLIGLLFWSCGAKYHLNRAIVKDPSILDSVALKVDTLIITQKEEVRDTLILQESRYYQNHRKKALELILEGSMTL